MSDVNYSGPLFDMAGLMGQRSPLSGPSGMPEPMGPYAAAMRPLTGGVDMPAYRRALSGESQNLGNVGTPMDWALEMAAPGRRLKQAVEPIASAAARAAIAPMPQLAERYPEMAPPEMKTDPKKGTEYLGKVQSPEESELYKVRTSINKDMEKGYEPYFDPEKRFDVDPQNFQPSGRTIDRARPAKEATVAKYQTEAENPQGLQRLRDAYEHGAQLGGGDRWYQMGQVHNEFLNEFGPEEGNKRFKDLILNISGTTAGADPESNLLMAQYARYARQKGLPPPSAAYDVPAPSRGQYVTGNIRAAYEGSAAGDIDPGQNPKRHNFAYNFMGHADLPTLDEQMGQIWSGTKGYFGNTMRYGPHEGVLNNLAAEYGVSPREFQEVAWAGHKNKLDGYTPKPFISTINDAIERTSRITGLEPKDVVRRGLVRGEIPLYGAAGLIAAGAAGNGDRQ